MTNDNLNASPSTISSVAPCSPSELRRMKFSAWIVLGLCAVVFSMIFAFGSYPRPFVDRMNMFLGPMVVIAMAICAYAVLRFRKACVVWRQEQVPRNQPLH